MIRRIAFVLCASVALSALAQNEDSVAAIRAVLDAQAKAWNRGDIRGYMNGYLRDSETMFVGSDGVTRGWDTVFERYKKKYDTRAKMGTLSFSDLDFRGCDSEVFVTGAWAIAREPDNPHGRFTLIFHRTSAGWRIVYDHSS